MRYFKTSNASRQYAAGEHRVLFEPIANIGGSWLGVIAVDVESAAVALAEAAHPQVTEISVEEFEELKKKPSSLTTSYREVVQPQAPSSPVSTPPPAAPVATPESTSSTDVALDLTVAAVEVPDELKLEGAKPKAKAKR